MAAPEAEITQWEPGEVVGQYSLLGRIAVGGMAEIWLARQTGLAGFQRVVVIKKISDAYSQDPKFVEMFLDEARIAAQLSHPNIVQIYDLGEHHGSYYIVMEYLHGEDLGTVVRASVRARSPLAISHAVRIVAGAADGLAFAHERMGLDGKPLNIVHRDVSPHNVIVTYDGGVKLVDFGIAKARSRVSQTMDGTIKGKVNYLSPEQARGDPLDARSDVFSLGIVLYEAIGRCRLFNYDDVYMNLLTITGEGVIPPPSTLNKDISPELDAVVGKALTRSLESRYGSARQLQLALEAWLRKSSDAPGSFEISQTMRQLFAERIAKRTKLIESAQRGDTAPHQFEQALEESREPAAAPAAAAPGKPPAPPAGNAQQVAGLQTVLLQTPAREPAPSQPPASNLSSLPRMADPQEAVSTSLGISPLANATVGPSPKTNLGVAVPQPAVPDRPVPPAVDLEVNLRTNLGVPIQPPADPEVNLKTSLGVPIQQPADPEVNLKTSLGVPIQKPADPEVNLKTSLGVPIQQPADPEVNLKTSLGVPIQQPADPEVNLRTSLGVPAQSVPIESLSTRLAVPIQQRQPPQRSEIPMVSGARPKDLPRSETVRVAVVPVHAAGRSKSRLWIAGAISVALVIGLCTYAWIHAGSKAPAPVTEPR